MSRRSASDGVTPAARFAVDLAEGLGRPLTAADRLALAVSGGPDSMAMLALADQAFSGRVIAATVDHGLRAGAADESAMVADCCAGLGIAHATLRPTAPIAEANLQAGARYARYALLGAWAIDAGATMLLTAHHLDDQAETFLMRAGRGSGPAGLAGIRRCWIWERRRWHAGVGRDGAVGVADIGELSVVRPLLGWRRSELAGIVADRAIRVVTDPSNADPRFDRVRTRALLAAETALDPVGLARSAAICGEADAALAATIAWLTKERTLPSDRDAVRIEIGSLPRELCRRLARDAIGYVRNIASVTEGAWSSATNVEALLDALEAGSAATLAGVMASANGTIWHFRRAPPRRATSSSRDRPPA